VGLHQPHPDPRLGAGARVFGVAELDPDPVSQPLDGLGEAEVVDLAHEVDHVAPLTTAEAVEEASRRGDLEARRLLVVKGAQALQRAAAGVAQRDVGADDVLDLGAVTNGRHVLVVDPACHGAEFTSPRWGTGC
jgi:hypothetical protein